MTREQRAKVSAFLRYTVLIVVGIIMVYPLIWMVGATSVSYRCFCNYYCLRLCTV